VVKIRLVIVDKREVVRQGLARLLEAEPNFEVVNTADTAWDIVERWGEHQPDVIFISSSLSECGGTEAISYVHERLPRANIIVTTDCDTNEDLITIAGAGVRAYLCSEIRADSLIKAITLVAEGKFVASPQMSARLLAMFDSFRGRGGAASLEGIPLLTRREKAVLDLVRQGLTNREIAAALFISENTVKVHLRNIMEKLHAHTRQEAVALLTADDLLSKVTQAGIKQV
jgi:DNA-binding NarL/FixJ family response regulator